MGDVQAPLLDMQDQVSEPQSREENEAVRCQQDLGILGLQPMNIAMLVRENALDIMSSERRMHVFPRYTHVSTMSHSLTL